MLKRIKACAEQIRFVDDYLNNNNVAMRGDFDGNYYKQFFGILAQIVVGDYLGVKRPTSKGFDGGVDFVYKRKSYDVKCELRTCYYKPRLFVHNLVGQQIKYDVDYYFFVSYNKADGVFEFCGRISKKDFLKYSKSYPHGHERTRTNGTSFNVGARGGLYEVKQKYLEEVKNGFE